MTQKEILAYNKRCAEFLGFKYKNTAKFWAIYPLDNNSYLRQLGYVKMDNLKFHSDWNWIMEVLNKISSLDYGWKITSKYVNIYSHAGDPLGEFDCKHSTNCPKNVTLDVVRTINRFLIWYNENKSDSI